MLSDADNNLSWFVAETNFFWGLTWRCGSIGQKQPTQNDGNIGSRWKIVCVRVLVICWLVVVNLRILRPEYTCNKIEKGVLFTLTTFYGQQVWDQNKSLLPAIVIWSLIYREWLLLISTLLASMTCPHIIVTILYPVEIPVFDSSSIANVNTPTSI